MSKRKKKKRPIGKRNPQEKKRRKKLREKRQKAKRNARLRKEERRLELLKIEEDKLSKITTKDFENWHFDWFNQNGALEIDYTPSDKIKMFFDEFSLRTDMEYKMKGIVHSFTNEYGIVMFSNEGDKNRYNRNFGWVDNSYFTCDDTLHLDWIVSDPSNRKKGWGTEIMETMVELSKKYDISISLFAYNTELDKSNKKDQRNNISFSKFVNGKGPSRYELIDWYKSLGAGIDPRLHTRVGVSYFSKKPLKVYDDSYLMFPSGSVEETIKFPSIKGYSGNGFSYSSTIDCMDKIVYEN